MPEQRDDRLALLERVFKGADDDPPGRWFLPGSDNGAPQWVDARKGNR